MRARPVVAADIARFDHVLAMDRSHLAATALPGAARLADRPTLFD